MGIHNADVNLSKTCSFSGNVISWKLYKKLTENQDFSKKEEPESLPDMFKKVKKGSQAYNKILQSNPEFVFGPKNTIEKRWKISEKM